MNLLLPSFHAALAAVDPLRIVPPHLPTPPMGRTLVVGAGKAAARMAQAVEAHYPAPLSGIVVTRYGHALPTRHIEVLEAAHPVPDANSVLAAQRILHEAQQLAAEDLLLVLLSGGGSSLLSLPLAGVTLSEVQHVTQALLRSGARIEEINTVRKHLSAIQGGRLAAATLARVEVLIISDVTGDDPTHIASGPCAPDPSTFSDALEVLSRYRISPSENVLRTLQDGALGHLSDTPKPHDARLKHARNHIIASGAQMLQAAQDFFHVRQIDCINLGDAITGEARLEAARQAAQIKALRASGQHGKVLISGGETTVTVTGTGRGGRNTEFLLALARALQGEEGVYAIACGTDGIDGTENNAGAILTPDTLQRASRLGLDAAAHLQNNDSYGFFAALGDLVVTGATYTNVNDYRAVWLGSSSPPPQSPPRTAATAGKPTYIATPHRAG